jgi:hypothetical protein
MKPVDIEKREYNEKAERLEGKLKEHFPLLSWHVCRYLESSERGPYASDRFIVKVFAEVNGEEVNADINFEKELIDQIGIDALINVVVHNVASSLAKYMLEWKPVEYHVEIDTKPVECCIEMDKG